jgi:hypothetical protein
MILLLSFVCGSIYELGVLDASKPQRRGTWHLNVTKRIPFWLLLQFEIEYSFYCTLCSPDFDLLSTLNSSKLHILKTLSCDNRTCFEYTSYWTWACDQILTDPAIWLEIAYTRYVT